MSGSVTELLDGLSGSVFVSIVVLTVLVSERLVVEFILINTLPHVELEL
jgi:hypothetical protein